MAKQANKSRKLEGLRWNGKGSIIDVPARDLTHAEVVQYGGYEALLRSGVYDEPEAQEDQARAEDHEETEK